MADMQHRTGEITLTVLGPDRRPLTDHVITVEQQRHDFAFGNIGFDFVGSAGVFGGASTGERDALAESWLGLFNTATLPFYWGDYEKERGKPNEAQLLAAAKWFAGQGVTVKGHPLLWHTVQPEWLLGLELDEVERLVRQRIRDLVTGFAGTIDLWDAINEAVIMPVFANGDNAITPLAWDRGRIAMVRMAFEEAREANPAATLVLNDFDLSSAYECLIEGVLEAGIQVDAIGLQTHMHQGYRGEEYMAKMLDRFARFGLPLHMTETTLLSGHLMPPEIQDLNDYQIPSWPSTPEGEERQAAEIVRHYKSLVGHPAVQSINYWGLTDDGAWLGAPVGFLRADGSRKPSYASLSALIHGEWWLSPTEMRTGPAGTVSVRGFFGDYAAGGEPFSIRRGQTDATIVLPG